MVKTALIYYKKNLVLLNLSATQLFVFSISLCYSFLVLFSLFVKIYIFLSDEHLS